MKNECECDVKSGEISEIKALHFGIKGQRKPKSLAQKYKKNAKVVKTKRKISSKLKRQLLKNYGLVIEDN